MKSLAFVLLLQASLCSAQSFGFLHEPFLTDHWDDVKLWATYYNVPMFNHEPEGLDLYDVSGVPSGLRLSLCNWCKAAIQGTVSVKKDGEVHLLNYGGRSTYMINDCRDCKAYEQYTHFEKTGKVLWKKSAGYGEGVEGYRLVPFRTVAVDPGFIPYGTVLFIPEARGVAFELEGKQYLHDGYFFAGDTGSKIKDDQIDVFLGTALKNPFPFVKSNRNARFDAVIIDNSVTLDYLSRLHR
jgi:3D (Asp-Asp-Asp) domain-containing protein